MTAKRTDSELEESMALQMRAVGLPEPVREYRFHPPRRWRFDFAWPDRMLALEVEGATWARGRHTRGSGFALDCSKYNQAVLDGWRVLRVTGEMVGSGEALGLVERAVGAVAYEVERV